MESKGRLRKEYKKEREREREGCERGETKRDGGQFQGVTEKKTVTDFHQGLLDGK